MNSLILPEEDERLLNAAQRGYYVAVQMLAASAVLLLKDEPEKLAPILEISRAMIDEIFNVVELQSKEVP